MQVFECLAIITYFCAINSDETERTMGIIWDFIHSDSKVCIFLSLYLLTNLKNGRLTDVVFNPQTNARKCSPNVLVAATSAWSFLVTSVDGWRFSSKNWQG